MFDAIVVGLLVSALAAGAIRVLRAWSQSRGSCVRELPPLIVIPRPVTGVEPMIGAVIRPSPPTAPLAGQCKRADASCSTTRVLADGDDRRARRQLRDGPISATWRGAD